MPAIHTHTDTWNRRGSAILTPALLTLTLAGAPAWAAQAEAPRPAESGVEPAASNLPLMVAEPLHDFGTLVKGDTVSHTFVLGNLADEPVIIERVAASCGCTVAKFDETIPAGSQGTLVAELDTLTLTGDASSSIEVYVKGRKSPAATVYLKAKVVPLLLAHPGYARWIYVQHEVEGTISNTVYSQDGGEFQILEVEAPMPAIEVSFRPATPEERREKVLGSQWQIDASLDSAAPVGPITGYLTVHTDHPRQKVMQIPLSGFVRPTLFVEPPRGDFGTLKIRAPRRATYQVRNFATEPIALTGAETDVPGISVKVEPVEEGRRYNVVLELDPAAMAEGPFDGELRLTTDSAKVPTVTVDLSGNLIRPGGETGG